MWPVLLDMSRDDCRRTLRRLELEAYSSMISVFRAQGALEDNRKKMLEELRGALHISSDRHNAEARRVSNDELLATIAEQLSGPNTNLGWISEGRRRIPLMPRGIPQTAYAEIADQSAGAAVEENININSQSENEEIEEMLIDSESSADVEIKFEKHSYPIVMEDQTFKLLEAESPVRKKFKSESDNLMDNQSVPSTMRVNNQKHLNISQIYSAFSKTPTAKIPNQPKHLFNQGTKAANKASQPHSSKPIKHRSHKQSAATNKTPSSHSGSQKHQLREALTYSGSMSQMTNQSRTPNLPMDSKGNVSGFQATFTQSLKKHKPHKDHFSDDLKLSTVHDPQSMQILNQSIVLDDSNSVRLHETLDTNQFQPQDISQFHTPTSQGISKMQHNLSSKACHFIIKKKNDPNPDNPLLSPQKIQMSGIQMIQKPAEIGGVKVLQNCQVFVTPSTAGPKLVNTAGKIIVTQATPKLQTQTIVSASPHSTNSNINFHIPDSKLIIVSNNQTLTSQSSTIQTSNIKSKNIILSASPIPKKDLTDVGSEMTVDTENIAKSITIGSNDLKMSTKTLFLNSKGHKMVVLPKARAKTSLVHPMPLLQVKGIQARPTMKFVPVNSQPGSTPIKSAANIAIVSKPTITSVSNPTLNKILTVEATSTTKQHADLPDIKFIQAGSKTPIQTLVKQSGTKSNVIVVQKGMALNKGSITFTRNGNELPKIVMSNKVINPLNVQSSSLIKSVSAGPKVALSVPDTSKSSSNIIVLELSNDQMARAASVPDAIENEATSTTILPEEGLIIKEESVITEDTPVLFDSQITEETCNNNSVDSMTESLMDMVQLDTVESDKLVKKELGVFDAQNTSNNNDWEMELETVDVKQKRVNDLSLEMGISSDSETDAYLVKEKVPKRDARSVENTPGKESEVQTHSFTQHDILNRAGRTLLSQLQDDGSSSNDSPFIVSKSTIKPPSRLLGNAEPMHKLKIEMPTPDKMHSLQADMKKELTAHQPEPPLEKSQPRPRIDIFSTAIASADINLDSFEYLEESMMSTDEMFRLGKTNHAQGVNVDSSTNSANKDTPALDLQLSELLAEGNVNSAGEKPLRSSFT